MSNDFVPKIYISLVEVGGSGRSLKVPVDGGTPLLDGFSAHPLQQQFVLYVCTSTGTDRSRLR